MPLALTLPMSCGGFTEYAAIIILLPGFCAALLPLPIRWNWQREKVDKYKDDIWQLTDLLQKEKKCQNRMSFNDLILNAVHLLRNGGYLRRHAKYGIGTVIQEDDTIIEVEFDGYGKKEFLKAFTQIERL